MKNKLVVIIEIIVIIGASLYYVFSEVIPDYKKSMGSSDRFIKTSEYKNMLELNIDNEVNFALVINQDKKIYHMMFLNEKAVCLYNKSIEGMSISLGLDKIIQILIENGYLKATSITKVVKYGDDYYNEFKSSLLKGLEKYRINTNIIEESNTLSKKADELELEVSLEADFESILRVLDNYSKEFPRMEKSSKKDEKFEVLNDDNSKKIINNVYKKIENYVEKNKITNLDKDNTELLITMIPADSDLKYYPSSNSWYYVIDGKVYAYIEIVSDDKSYSYCFNGAIDLNKKGMC